MISTALLAQATALIEQRTGLSVQTQQRANIREILLHISFGEPEVYLRKLRQQEETSEDWQRLIHTLTIGETYFLRDKRHFEILRSNILPRLTLDRRQKNDMRLSIWCVGCSTGEEPYSVATALHEFIGDIAQWQIMILGTDIDQQSIETARRGVYRQWSFRHTPAHFIKRYFTEREDGYHIDDFIKSMVTFKRHNLHEGPAMPSVDIIFCRNVLMYFGQERVIEAENTFYRALIPEGWLLLGQAEALHSRDNEWIMHMHPGTPIYQKPGYNQKHRAETISYPTRPQVSDVQPETVEEAASYADAVKAVHEDRPADAEHILSRLLTENPDHARAHTLIASIFASRQAYPEATAHIEQALNLNGLLADAHYVRALIQLEQEDLDAVVQCLNAAIYCQRGHALAAFTLGNLHAQQGDLIKAHKHWRNAHKAVLDLDEDAYVSDLTDLQADALRALLEQNLDHDGDT